MLAALVVHLKANYGNLTSGLKVAQNSVASTAGSISSSVRRVVGGMAGLVGVGTVVAGVTSQLESLDKVAKLSTSIVAGSR